MEDWTERNITAAKMTKTQWNIKKYLPKHYQCKKPWIICSICLYQNIYSNTSSRHLNCRYLHNSCISQAINHSWPNNGPSVDGQYMVLSKSTGNTGNKSKILPIICSLRSMIPVWIQPPLPRMSADPPPPRRTPCSQLLPGPCSYSPA